MDVASSNLAYRTMRIINTARTNPRFWDEPRLRPSWGSVNKYCVEWRDHRTFWNQTRRTYYKNEIDAKAGLERRWRMIYQMMYDQLPANWYTIKV